MNLNGTTVPFAVLGHPVAHTLSPLMHNASLRNLGINAVYSAYDVAPENLMDVLHSMHYMGFKGVNLTIPLKEIAFNGIKRCDKSAEIAGAVNTVAFDENGLLGYSTDAPGFLNDLRESFGISPAKRRVMILGCGGVGRTLAIASALNNASEIMLYNRTASRAETLASDILAFSPETSITLIPPGEHTSFSREADIIIQCTSCGMKPGDTPILPAHSFREGQFLYDTIYIRPTTIQMAEARKAGAVAANGLGMLLHQGAESFRIWTGAEPDINAMRNALESAVYLPGGALS